MRPLRSHSDSCYHSEIKCHRCQVTHVSASGKKRFATIVVTSNADVDWEQPPIGIIFEVPTRSWKKKCMAITQTSASSSTRRHGSAASTPSSTARSSCASTWRGSASSGWRKMALASLCCFWIPWTRAAAEHLFSLATSTSASRSMVLPEGPWYS